MCRRCGTDVHSDDSFCQECGLPNAAARQDTGSLPERISPEKLRSDFDWPALEADPEPIPARYRDDAAGTRIAEQTYAFANYQLDLQPYQTFSADQLNDLSFDPNSVKTQNTDSEWIDFEPARFDLKASQSSIVMPASPVAAADVSLLGQLNFAPAQTVASGQIESRTAAKHLHSPLFDGPPLPTAPAQDNGLGMRGGWSMVAIDLAVVAAVVVFVSALGVKTYSDYKKAQAQKIVQLASEVKSAALKQDYELVYKNLNFIKGKSILDARQQALFDQSAFRLGQKEFDSGRAAQAMDYLKEVSIESDYYTRARQMIFNFSVPLFQATENDTTANTLAQESSTTGKASTDKTDKANSPKKLSAAALNPSKQLSDKPVLSLQVIPEIEKNATASADQAETAGRVEPIPTPKFSESEISRYNRQLATYFAKHGSASESAEQGASEPPTFKEWLRQGKPAF